LSLQVAGYAEGIAYTAHHVAGHQSKWTPFAEAILQHENVREPGGKLDDIMVVVARIGVDADDDDDGPVFLL
jgi:hypothetical protein